VTCRPIARERLGKHIPTATNTQATIGQLLLLWNGTVNTTVEEPVFSMWFSYIHCWATVVFSMGPPPDCISSTGQNEIRTRMDGILGSQGDEGLAAEC
jgi:hypothetical protein